MLEEDVAANRAIGGRGADLLRRAVAGRRRDDAGGLGSGSTPTATPAALACVEWGTALGVVRALHDARRLAHVSTPTRPVRCCRAAGSRPGSSTAWAPTTGWWSTAPARR